MTSMKRIIDYSSSSDSDNETGNEQPGLPKKPRNEKDSDVECRIQKKVENRNTSEKNRPLKIPAAVTSMFSNQSKQDCPEMHGGRKRSFAHVRGNWASFVNAPIPDKIGDGIKRQVFKSLKSLEIKWTMCDEFHITLSRTVPIPHHCIEPLYHELKSSLSTVKRFRASLQSSVRVYMNDEKTRTFLALSVDEKSHIEFASMIKLIDVAFKTFRLPQYHHDPSTHMSFAWTCGDVISSRKLPPDMLLLSSCFQNLLNESPHLFEIDVDKVLFKAGNKMMVINLL